MSRRGAAIARGIGLQVLARAAVLPLSLITLAIATRYLGQEGYGILTTAVVFVGLFETFSEIGIGTIIVRRVSGQGSSLPGLVGVNLAFSITFALPLAAVAAVVGLVVYRGDTTTQLAVLIIAIGLVFTTVAKCYDPVFDVRLRYGAVVVAEAGGRMITVAAAALVALTDAGLLAMCAVQVLPPLLRLVATAIGAHRLERVRPVISPRTVVGLVKESLPLTLSTIIGVLYWRADGALLSWLSDTVQVAAYGIALQMAFSLAMLPQVFSRSVLSTISEGYAHDPEKFRRAITRGYQFLFLCSAPVAVLGWPLAPRLIQLIGSSEYVATATPVLRLFFIAAATGFLTGILSAALTAGHQLRFLVILSGINLAVNVALNVVLIPLLGAVGTGIALIVSETSGVLFAQLRLRKLGVAPLPASYLLRLLPGLGLALLLIWLTWELPLVLVLLAGGLSFLVGAWAGGALSPQMRAALLGALRPGAAKESTEPPDPVTP